MLILNRLQTGKTPAFSQGFARFFLLLCAIPNAGPVFLVEQLQAIQPGYDNTFSIFSEWQTERF
jgi:hypothetical protein